jgi:hypothetical protein
VVAAAEQLLATIAVAVELWLWVYVESATEGYTEQRLGDISTILRKFSVRKVSRSNFRCQCRLPVQEI